MNRAHLLAALKLNTSPTYLKNVHYLLEERKKYINTSTNLKGFFSTIKLSVFTEERGVARTIRKYSMFNTNTLKTETIKILNKTSKLFTFVYLPVKEFNNLAIIEIDKVYFTVNDTKLVLSYSNLMPPFSTNSSLKIKVILENPFLSSKLVLKHSTRFPISNEFLSNYLNKHNTNGSNTIDVSGACARY